MTGSRRARILELLGTRPLAIFEVATLMEVNEHQISGRFSELERDGYIHKTGERRWKPATECDAEVYDLVRVREETIDRAAQLGYPPTLMIDGEPYDRQELLPREGYPGIPYSRRADTGGLRLVVRVELIECPGCGRPLKMLIAEDGKAKLFSCGSPACNNRVWHGATPREPGGPQLLALVMKTM